MGAMTMIQMAERVSALLEERLKVRGRSLSEKVRKAGGRLPRKVRKAAALLGQVGDMAQNPKLLGRVDEAEVARAFDTCMRHFSKASSDGKKSAVAGVVASIGFAIFTVILLVLGVIYWRGLV